MKLGVIPLCDRSITDRRWTAEFLTLLEEEGVESVWMPEHVVMAQDYEPLYDYSEDGRAPISPTTVLPDPLQWLNFAAALTTRIRLCTGVLIGPQHSAAMLAKRLATLDALSGGRLEVGIGIGWQKEEYEAVGVPFEHRGRRLDECMDAMRELWANDPATFQGDFVKFKNVFCDTKPHNGTSIPLLVGGSSEAAARRAGLRGDGFHPYVMAPEVLVERIRLMHETAQRAGRNVSSLPVALMPSSYQPKGSFDLALMRDYVSAGVDRFIIAAYEASSHDIDGIRRLIKELQDRILAKI